ncbi:hypothetical protein K492DRAFT_177880 [Lichtheimia hyalospora FSU 10163]|nr:hypothetical protein K492DRAFT_177880 [Lichtheimia hyalospora FSU 10163]
MRESVQPGGTKIISYSQRHAIHPHPYSRNADTTTAHYYQRYRTHTSSSSSSSSSSSPCNKKCNDTISLPSMQLKNPQKSSSACGIPVDTSKTYFAARTSKSMGNGGGSSGSKKSPSFQAQWMFFSNSQWIPLDTQSHLKLERTLQLDGVFVDIQDSHFPGVERIRVFPGADYLSYLGIRYRICRVLLPSL